METFKNRLLEYARLRFDMGQSRFEDYCGINRGTISAIKVQGPTASIVMKIAIKCQDLDLNWLFRGEGDMLLNRNSQHSQPSAPSVSIGTIQTVNIGNWGELVELLKNKGI